MVQKGWKCIFDFSSTLNSLQPACFYFTMWWTVAYRNYRNFFLELLWSQHPSQSWSGLFLLSVTHLSLPPLPCSFFFSIFVILLSSTRCPQTSPPFLICPFPPGLVIWPSLPASSPVPAFPDQLCCCLTLPTHSLICFLFPLTSPVVLCWFISTTMLSFRPRCFVGFCLFGFMF